MQINFKKKRQKNYFAYYKSLSQILYNTLYVEVKLFKTVIIKLI